MKIGIMVDTLSVGGAERQAILCVSELRKLGHAADLIHYRPSVEYAPMLRQLELSPVYVKAGSFFQRCARLGRLFRERQYDVVHGFKMAAEVYAAFAGRWGRVPHRFGSFRSIYALGPKYCCLHYVVDKLLDGWVVNSKVGAESMARRARISRKKIFVLHNGVNCQLFSSSTPLSSAKAALGIPGDSIVVTMVARLEPGKNHRLLLDAAAIVVRDAPHARFLVVGKGSMGNLLPQYARQAGVADRVSFLGERSDVAEILAATDISVLSTDFEGMPNTLLEAMAAVKPIVCTNYPGADEILAHESNALLSSCGEPESFARNIKRLIQDPELRQRLAGAGHQMVRQKFSNETMARNLETIYRQFEAVPHRGLAAT
jgi:glycosyltransferase involved in cell wall biosynthesis